MDFRTLGVNEIVHCQVGSGTVTDLDPNRTQGHEIRGEKQRQSLRNTQSMHEGAGQSRGRVGDGEEGLLCTWRLESGAVNEILAQGSVVSRRIQARQLEVFKESQKIYILMLKYDLVKPSEGLPKYLRSGRHIKVVARFRCEGEAREAGTLGERTGAAGCAR